MDDSDDDHVDVGSHRQDPSISWQCPRCHETVRVKNSSTNFSDPLPDEVSNLRLQNLKQEHEDFHFARDLHMEERSSGSGGGGGGGGVGGQNDLRTTISNTSKGAKSGKKKKAPDGIKAFFTTKPKDSS